MKKSLLLAGLAILSLPVAARADMRATTYVVVFTSTMEQFHLDRHTCNHQTLPFGAVLRLTAGDRVTYCRVNDRHYLGGMGYDLGVTDKIAKELNFGYGGATVRVEYVGQGIVNDEMP